MNILTAKSGCVARIALSLVLLISAGAANAARFLYTGGHGLDDPRVAALGHTYAEFSADDAGWAAALAGTYGPFSAILVGEDSGSTPLTLATTTAIASFVSGGGRVIIASDHNANAEFMNAVFGYSTTIAYGCEDADNVAGTRQAGAVGTSFAAGPAAVGNLSCTSALNSASVPASARKLYAGTFNAAPTTLAFAGGYGTGRLVWLGWDYCCGGSEAQNDDWYLVLDSAIKFSGATCSSLVGAQLTLCRQVCEVSQSPSTLAGLIKLYTAIYRVAPPCGGNVAPLRAPMAFSALN